MSDQPDVFIVPGRDRCILSKMIQHQVICDLNPTCKGPALHYDLTLNKDEEWWCDYLGFLDLDQLAEIDSAFDVTVNEVRTVDEMYKVSDRENDTK